MSIVFANNVDISLRIKYNKNMNDELKNMVNDLKALIAVPSVSSKGAPGAPFGTENRRALDVFLSAADKLGLHTGDDDGYAGWAEYGEGELLTGVLAHLDVVPADGGWTSPPFALDIRNGIMYGRGVSDDKGPLVASLYALARIARQRLRLRGRVRIIAGCNEEEGSACIKHYAAHCEIPKRSFTPDSDFPVTASEKGIAHISVTLPHCAATASALTALSGGTRPNIVPDVCRASLLPVSPAAKAAGCTELETRGVSAHGSAPEKGVNAINAMLKKLSSLLPDDKGLSRAADILAAPDAPERLGLGKTDDTGKATMNTGVCSLSGGRITLVLDFRLPALYTEKDAVCALSSTLPEGTEIAVLHSAPALVCDADGELVSALMKVYRECTGDVTSQPLHIGGGTYAKELPGCVAFGAVFPGAQTHMHEADECYPLSDFEKLTDIYYNAILALDALG